MKTIPSKTTLLLFMLITMNNFLSAELSFNKETMTFYSTGARKKIDSKKYNEIIFLIIAVAQENLQANVKLLKKTIKKIVQAHKSPASKQVLRDIRKLSIKNKSDFDKLYQKFMG